jgi:HNH endonuclease
VTEPSCKVKGCDRAVGVKQRGLCLSHYQQEWKLHRNEWKAAREGACCRVEGCQRRVMARSLCNMHYQRWRLKGDVGPVEPLQLNGGRCLVRGCSRWSLARGWCRLHYDRWRRHGEPGEVAAHKYAGYLNRNGYFEIRVDGRRIFQHRYVIEQHLGRRLLPEENVHHKNGIRHDNRLENPELWLTRQPSGQRVSDLIAFVVEHYPAEVANMLRKQRPNGAHRQDLEHPTLW